MAHTMVWLLIYYLPKTCTSCPLAAEGFAEYLADRRDPRRILRADDDHPVRPRRRQCAGRRPERAEVGGTWSGTEMASKPAASAARAASASRPNTAAPSSTLP